MNNNIAVNADARNGASLEDVIRDMIALSGRMNVPVSCEFRGVVLYATQSSTVSDVRTRYHLMMELKS